MTPRNPVTAHTHPSRAQYSLGSPASPGCSCPDLDDILDWEDGAVGKHDDLNLGHQNC